MTVNRKKEISGPEELPLQDAPPDAALPLIVAVAELGLPRIAITKAGAEVTGEAPRTSPSGTGGLRRRNLVTAAASCCKTTSALPKKEMP